jgi:hypothetical protein
MTTKAIPMNRWCKLMTTIVLEAHSLRLTILRIRLGRP